MNQQRFLSVIVSAVIIVVFAITIYGQDNDFKQFAFKEIDKQRSDLIEIADAIWEFAEIELQEKQSSELLADYLEKAGFEVKRGVAGLETAFTATWGNGNPRIGILAEYDALPGLSQKKGIAEKTPLVEGGAGHGCGHNIYGTACAGAAIALKKLMEQQSISGTIVFYGCPAEETVVGKVIMAKAGLFDDLDAAITWHPGLKTKVTLTSSLALNSFEVGFSGKTAHGAADPWNGRSALDALEMFHFGINLLREHIKPTVRIHYIVKNGGAAPNVVPDHAKGWYYVRDVTREGVKDTYRRIMNIAEGAAKATETELKVRLITGVHDELVNMEIAKAHYANLKLVGPPEFTDEEQNFAKSIQKYLGIEEKGIRTGIESFEIDPAGRGSTDVAEVSRIVPLAEFSVAMGPADGPWHNWVVVSCGATSIAHKAMMTAAKTLSATTIDLLTDPALLDRAKKEFEEKMAGKKYVSPLDEMQ